MLSSQRSVASQTGQNRRRQICDRSRCDSTVFASQQARPCVRAPLRPCVGGSVRACVRASMRPCIRPRNLQRRWVIKTLLKASKLLMLRNVKTLQRLYKINDFDAVASNSSSSSKQQQQQQRAAAARLLPMLLRLLVMVTVMVVIELVSPTTGTATATATT